MSRTVVVATPFEAFAGRVQRLVGDRCHHVWRERLLVTQLAELAGDVTRHDPHVVLVGPGLYDAAALDLVAAVDRARPDTVVVLVAEPSPELWPAAARAGARDVLSPDEPDEVLAAALARAVTAAEQRRASLVVDAPSPSAPQSRVMSVFSPKGGAGKTTVATNVAVALTNREPGSTVLVDLDLQFGGVCDAIGLAPSQTIADAAQAADHLDGALLKMQLTTHPSGLFVLAAPLSLAQADDVTPERLDRILDQLAGHFRHVIVDTAAGIDVVTVSALARSTDLLAVSTPDVGCVRALRRALDALDAVGVRDAEQLFVFNRADVKGGLGLNDLRSVTGATDEILIPDSRAVAAAMNAGQTIVDTDPRSTAAKAFLKLADRLGEPAVSTARKVVAVA